MDIYRIRESEERSLSEIRKYIFETLFLAGEGYQIHEGFSEAFPFEDQFLFVRIDDASVVWVKILLEPLSHAMLDSIRDDVRKFLRWNEDQNKPYIRIQYDIFFPTMNKGIQESLELFSFRWHFFEFCFVENQSEISFAYKELTGQAGQESSQIEPIYVEENRDPWDRECLRKARLDREELKDLIDLSLALKKS